MVEFSKLIFTTAGRALIAKIMAGEVSDVDFTKVAASKAKYALDELEALSALPDIMQEVEISYKARTNDVTVTIEAAFSNHDLTVGYSMNTLGLFAVDPDEGEILYAACVELSGHCYMPPFNGVTASGAFIRLITTVGNADRIFLEVNPTVTATVADLQRLEKRLDKLAEPGIPDGGEAGQVLIKKTEANQDVEWKALTASDIGAVPNTLTVNGKALNSDITLSAADIGALAPDGAAAAATKLVTARTIRTNLASTSTASFDGTKNVTPGVTGILPVANGGTGLSSPLITYGTADLTAGSSALAAGTIYLVYE